MTNQASSPSPYVRPMPCVGERPGVSGGGGYVRRLGVRDRAPIQEDPIQKESSVDSFDWPTPITTLPVCRARRAPSTRFPPNT